MKTKKMNLKAIVLSLGLVAMILPSSAMAQKTTERPGGLFGRNDQPETSLLHRSIYEKRDWISMWVPNLSKNPLLWVVVSSF